MFELSLKSYKISPIASCPGNIITTGVESISKVIQRLLKAVEEGDKMFQKLVKTRVPRKPESIYLLITYQNINKSRITKTASSNICSKRKYSSVCISAWKSFQ